MILTLAPFENYLALPGHVDKVRARYPQIRVIVHPECR